VKLSRVGGKTTVQEVWASRLMRVHFSNAIRVGDVICGSSGDFGPAPFTAIDVKTGKVLWRNRSFPRASFLFADGRFIILDEDGQLLLATATADGLTVVSKTELLSNQAWTVPSLAGTRTLPARPQKHHGSRTRRRVRPPTSCMRLPGLIREGDQFEGAGSHAGDVFEDAREVALIRKARAECDGRQIVLRQRQLPARIINP
jgi:hypothetical protein